jgi:hypothetical protein
MTRWFVVFGCAFALALAAPVGSDAEAQKAKGKACVAKSMDGKQTKWRCKASEKCCYDWLSSKGTCSSSCM